MTWCGVVAFDKPIHWTSRQVVDRVAQIVRPAKAGHAGTLDPLATGVLLVAVGPATRLISYLQQGRKQYVGSFRLGKRSDTDDIEGQIVDGGDWSGVTREQILQGLSQFVGVIEQVPPQFSAVHVKGRRAYSLARKGQHADLQAKSVEVHSIELAKFEPPDLELTIECGSGTYVRSIGRDLGELLGCGAVMTSLRRLRVGSFGVEEALNPESLDEQRLRQALQPALRAVANLPRRIASPDEIRAIRQGKVIVSGALENLPAEQEVTLIDGTGELVAIARLSPAQACLQPCVVLPPVASGLQDIPDA